MASMSWRQIATFDATVRSREGALDALSLISLIPTAYNHLQNVQFVLGLTGYTRRCKHRHLVARLGALTLATGGKSSGVRGFGLLHFHGIISPTSHLIPIAHETRDEAIQVGRLGGWTMLRLNSVGLCGLTIPKLQLSPSPQHSKVCTLAL